MLLQRNNSIFQTHGMSISSQIYRREADCGSRSKPRLCAMLSPFVGQYTLDKVTSREATDPFECSALVGKELSSLVADHRVDLSDEIDQSIPQHDFLSTLN